MTTANQKYTRRDILRFSLASAGLTALGPLAGISHAAPDNRKFVVLVNLDGGNDSLNTVVPVNTGSYYDRRPSLAIDNPLNLTSGPAATANYGLHPNLGALQELHHEGSLALIQKVGYPDANHSHFTSKDVFHTGDSSSINANEKTGWVARYAELYNNHTLGCVSVGYNAKALQGPEVSLLQVDRLSSFGYRADGRYRGESERRLEVAKAMLEKFESNNANTVEIRKALQVGHENIDKIEAAVNSYTANVEYPTNTRFGRSLESISQLVHAGNLGTDVYYTGIGGFDTHSGQGSTGGRHPNLMNELNSGLSSFAQDMKMLGKWDDCVVVVFSEFGRRNFENGSGGTDHGAGQTMMVAGGAVNGGHFGSDISEDDIRNNGSLPMEVDFRAIFGEVIDKHLGQDSSQVFTDPNRLTTNALGFL